MPEQNTHTTMSDKLENITDLAFLVIGLALMVLVPAILLIALAQNGSL